MSDLKSFLGRSRMRAALIAAALAFALSQIMIVAHAAKYGDGPHEHSGQACVLSLAAPGGDKTIATAVFLFVGIVAVWRAADQVAQTELARMGVRAARPRGPPSL